MAQPPEAPDTTLEPIGSVQRTQVGREATEPMREDIRLLGAMLGDIVREQNGDEVFDLVERARVESFRVRRSEIDRAELVKMFDGIDVRQAIPVIRAFTHFALLANVAEDIHRERRRAIHVAAGRAAAGQQSGRHLPQTRRRRPRRRHGRRRARRRAGLAGHHRAPHRDPTPHGVRHPAPHHRADAAASARVHRTPEGSDVERELRRQILTLWQTALIRLSRLKIQDEIETGLRYYAAAFFEVIPQVNAEVRSALQDRWPGSRDPADEPILRPGSWIGGDRDGNPNVTAEVVRLATGSAAYTAFAHYFAELTALEQELSMSMRLVHDQRATWPRSRTPATSLPAPTSRTGGRCASCTPG